MPFKVVTLKEWKAMGLPVETSNIYFGNNSFVKKLKEENKKIQKKKKK